MNCSMAERPVAETRIWLHAFPLWFQSDIAAFQELPEGPGLAVSRSLHRGVIHEVEDLLWPGEHAGRKTDQRGGAREVPERNGLDVAGSAAPMGHQRQHCGAPDCRQA